MKKAQSGSSENKGGGYGTNEERQQFWLSLSFAVLFLQKVNSAKIKALVETNQPSQGKANLDK